MSKCVCENNLVQNPILAYFKLLGFREVRGMTNLVCPFCCIVLSIRSALVWFVRAQLTPAHSKYVAKALRFSSTTSHHGRPSERFGFSLLAMVKYCCQRHDYKHTHVHTCASVYAVATEMICNYYIVGCLVVWDLLDSYSPFRALVAEGGVMLLTTVLDFPGRPRPSSSRQWLSD
eukprot:4502990-Amphidinium_carterae.1